MENRTLSAVRKSSAAAVLLAVTFAAQFLSGCATTGNDTDLVIPVAVANPSRSAGEGKDADGTFEKVFVLRSDWHHNSWVMKRGARISFERDGFGSFSCVIYSVDGSMTEPNELHFQSVQYGQDGNSLFVFPGRDTGKAMQIRKPHRDYPYDQKFAFDARYFDSITSAKWFARLRLVSEGAGVPPAQAYELSK